MEHKHRKGSAFSRRDAAAYLRLMFEHTDQIGIVLMDSSGCIRGWNRGASHITGFTAEEVVGKRCGTVLFTPEDRERKLDEHELFAAQVVGFAHDERWHMRKDGQRFWSSGVCMPLTDRKGALTGFVKTYRDMTHLRARIKYLENVLQEQVAQHHQRDAFIGTIAHELRNPLAPVKSATQVIERLVPDDGRFAQPVKTIERQVAALERLVEDLIDLTRVKVGRFTLAYQRVALQDIVGHAVESARPLALGRQIEFQFAFPSVPIEVELDPGRIHQVLVNLLNNAVKYTPPGGTVWITATVDQTHALVFVKDNGIGIAPDLLPKIFDMFTQAPNADSRRGAGLGIGLALVKQLVELHQGTVEVRSEGEGKGSEFSVRIPLLRPHGGDSEPFLG